MSLHKVFIDGSAGTTGLQICDRLAARGDIELLALDEAHRKDPAARAEMLNTADIVFLCLPDDAAREAVSLITNPGTRVIDASTAHRTALGQTARGHPRRQARRQPRLPRHRLYQHRGAARRRRAAAPKCRARLLFADRLLRRRQKDDRPV